MRICLFVVLACIFLVGIKVMKTDAGVHGSDLVCNKCHTMHASEDGELPTMPDEPGGTAEGPNPHLLYKADVTMLCLVCHDEQAGMPDVSGDDENNLIERAAGQFGTVDAINPNGHNLAPDTVGFTGTTGICNDCHPGYWGPGGAGFNQTKMGCVDCHEPHGKDPELPDESPNPDYIYRNLHYAWFPDDTPKITAFVNPSADELEVYERANIGYAAPTAQVSDWREVTNICVDCHHTFTSYYYTRLGNVPPDIDPDGTCIRHPNTDSEDGAQEYINRHGLPQTDPVHWEGGTGNGFPADPDNPDNPRLPFIVSGASDYGAATAVAQNNEVFCLTCHKAHGSEYASSLRWPYRTEDSNLGCEQCHNK